MLKGPFSHLMLGATLVLVAAGCQSAGGNEGSGSSDKDKYYRDGYSAARTQSTSYADETPRQTCYDLLRYSQLFGGDGSQAQKRRALQGCFDGFSEMGQGLDDYALVDKSGSDYQAGYSAGSSLGQPNDDETPNGACQRVTTSLSVTEPKAALAGCQDALIAINHYLSPGSSDTSY